MSSRDEEMTEEERQASLERVSSAQKDDPEAQKIADASVNSLESEKPARKVGQNSPQGQRIARELVENLRRQTSQEADQPAAEPKK